MGAEPLRTVLHVSSHGSTRTYKMAASAPFGWRVLNAWTVNDRPFDNALFDRSMRVHDIAVQVPELCTEFDVDVIQAMSRPDSITATLVHLKDWKRRPVIIHDAHEVVNGASPFEHVANTGSDFQVYVSEQIRQDANRLYHNERTSTWIGNLVPAKYVPKAGLAKTGKAVWAGSGWDRGYIEGTLIPNLADCGMDVDVYTYRSSTYNILVDGIAKHPNLRLAGSLLYQPLLKAMTQYDWGLLPTALPRSMQNKVADYVVAGLPILSWPSNKDTNRLIEKEHIGLVYRPGMKLPDPEVFKDDVRRYAAECVMDPHVRAMYEGAGIR